MGSTGRWSGTECVLGACRSTLPKRCPDCLVAESFIDMEVRVTNPSSQPHLDGSHHHRSLLLSMSSSSGLDSSSHSEQLATQAQITNTAELKSIPCVPSDARCREQRQDVTRACSLGSATWGVYTQHCVSVVGRKCCSTQRAGAAIATQLQRGEESCWGKRGAGRMRVIKYNAECRVRRLCLSGALTRSRGNQDFLLMPHFKTCISVTSELCST